MTAVAFADLVQAQPTGAGRWKARCPAHDDRSPSLSIREGDDGRVLVHCHAGCATAAILEAAGLCLRDLFAGPPLTPAQAREAVQERARRDEEARNRRIAHGAACARVRRLEAIADALGAKLARLPDDSPDGNALMRLFHQVQDRIRRAEADVTGLEVRS
jgi:hypothetical protein